MKDFRFQQQREVIFKQDKLTQVEGEDQIYIFKKRIQNLKFTLSLRRSSHEGQTTVEFLI